jgi:glycosyltransferase involved in cell wall biosynthesis
MRQIDVSVIIPVFNAMPYLHRSLESVVSQTLGTDRIEVVAVDDGSSDGSGEALDAWAERYPDLLRVVHAEAPSGGPAGPRNTGLDLATGRYVFFLDADDYLGTEALQRMLVAADANESDVVLGRMATTTGRALPSSSFRTTDLDADLFTSQVYWTLSVLKLFRRELLERNGIRFLTHFPILSDQPFTALAYLRARRISVLADYDYYFAEWRDDGKHVTRSGSVLDRMDVVEAMCDLVASEVPDADRRAPLIARHFQGDLWRVIRGIGLLASADQVRLVDRVATLSRSYLRPDVMSLLTPDRRVVLDLAGRGLLEETLAAVAGTSDELAAEVLVEGERAYALLPFFRDPTTAVPDERYEMGELLKGQQSLTSFGFAGAVLHLRGTAGLRRVDRRPTVEIVLRSTREPARQYVAPATVSDDGFSASVDLLTVADGAPLPQGRWAVFVRITVDELVRQRRLGAGGEAVGPATPATTALTLDTGAAWSARVVTPTGNGALVLRVETVEAGTRATGLAGRLRRLARRGVFFVKRADPDAPRDV